jgi:glycerophosphoryl diester phosphodiesterase
MATIRLVPLVYAHRGGSALRPENTILAFDHGLSLGADGLEFDVHLSRDGVVVVHHDTTLDRTTNGRGPLAALTADELARLDAGYFFRLPGGPPSPAEAALEGPLSPAESSRATARRPAEHPYRGLAEGVPTLRDVLRRYPTASMIIELKTNEPVLARKTIDEVRAAGAIDRVALGSFGTRVLRAARAYEPRIRTGSSQEETRLALYRSWIYWPVRHPRYQEYQVPEIAGSTRVVSPRFVRYAHEAGCPVKVWTVDDEADMRRLLSWGVDAIISDRPDVAVRVVREVGSRTP